MEITETLSKEIAEALLLDHPLTPLQFLAGDTEESSSEESEEPE